VCSPGSSCSSSRVTSRQSDRGNGWAVIDDNGIDVKTVSPTRRAAIVNWLVTHGAMILTTHSDQDIEDIWIGATHRHKIGVERVQITKADR
jgi:hypothetical protein